MMVQLAYATSLVIFPNMLLKHKASALQRDLDTKQAFVRYVSHEVRTPLNIVLTGLELLKLKLANIPDSEEPLDLVSDCILSTKTAVSILSDLLIYEKLESNLLVLEKTECHLLSFLVEHVRPFRLQADQKQIEMNIVPFRGTELTRRLEQIMVSIDATKIAQVLRNLVSNAVKFSPSGGKVDVFAEVIVNNNSITRSSRLSTIIKQSIGAAQVYAADSINSDSVVRVVVRDSGFGISAENQQKLFNEIVQFHANTQQGGGGSGLGLWISKQIVALHGGKVGVYSEGEGHGTEFYFELPIARIDLTRVFNPQLADVSPDSGIALARMRTVSVRMPMEVLLVDDSAMNRKLMGKLIAAIGNSYVEADDGDTCVEAVRERMASGGGTMFHAILIDGSMPRMSGPEAIKQVRELGYKGLIVGVTGNGGAEDIEEFIDAGADSVLLKPVSLDQIQQIFICV
jgi:signal transduction histidine kinase/ActR/RegA family two-component response regulator